MRQSQECHSIDGPLKVVESIEEAHRLVRETYPEAIGEGSAAHWGWKLDWSSLYGLVLAEAWPRRRSFGWNLRIRRTR